MTEIIPAESWITLKVLLEQNQSHEALFFFLLHPNTKNTDLLSLVEAHINFAAIYVTTQRH